MIQTMSDPFRQTYIVTWQTVVNVNKTDDRLSDEMWAVLVASGKVLTAIEYPHNDENDVFFTVESAGNGPQSKTFISIGDAMHRYEMPPQRDHTNDTTFYYQGRRPGRPASRRAKRGW